MAQPDKPARSAAHKNRATARRREIKLTVFPEISDFSYVIFDTNKHLPFHRGLPVFCHFNHGRAVPKSNKGGSAAKHHHTHPRLFPEQIKKKKQAHIS